MDLLRRSQKPFNRVVSGWHQSFGTPSQFCSLIIFKRVEMSLVNTTQTLLHKVKQAIQKKTIGNGQETGGFSRRQCTRPVRGSRWAKTERISSNSSFIHRINLMWHPRTSTYCRSSRLSWLKINFTRLKRRWRLWAVMFRISKNVTSGRESKSLNTGPCVPSFGLIMSKNKVWLKSDIYCSHFHFGNFSICPRTTTGHYKYIHECIYGWTVLNAEAASVT